MAFSGERRLRRSSRMHEALRFQLEAGAVRAGARALGLADHQGLGIAQSAPEAGVPEEVAALSPRLAPQRCFAGLVPCEQGSLPALIAPFELHARRAYLAAVGLRSHTALPVLQQASEGVRRILRDGPGA